MILELATDSVPTDQPAGVAAAIQGPVTVSNVKEAVTAQPGIDFDGVQVASAPARRTQILLRDETVLTLGPDSALTIEEFVYDPKQGAVKIVADHSKEYFGMSRGGLARLRRKN